MLPSVEVSWLQSFSSLKSALQETFGSSGQLLKKYYSSKQLSHSIKAGDVLSLPLDIVNHLSIHPEYIGAAAHVIAETHDWIAVHKPFNIHSHPLRYSDQDTLLNFLAEKGMWASLRVNKESYDRGLLYRLDYETSGVVVLAKNENLFQRIRLDFHHEIKRKLYWAIVEGDFDQEGIWTHYFHAIGIKGGKQKVTLDPHGDAQQGILKVKKVLEQDGKSLVVVNLKSGLRHQIRAQLAALGFPIMGDELYGGKKADRLFLHALRYEWTESVEDAQADLFESFFDLDSALKMTHDMIRGF
jgi:23S rRNA pseudouridine1911/1915/1917 synthase